MEGGVNVISVVTPSLNQAGYIDEAMWSVLSQEGDFFIDHVVVDGGSTDGSVDKIRALSAEVNSAGYRHACRGVSMRWVSEKDDGQSQAINKGLKMARGGLLTWINSDDYFLPGAFSEVAAAFARDPSTDFVHGDGLWVDGEGGTLFEHLSRPVNLSVQLSYQGLLGRFGYHILQQGTFWRKGVHGKLGYLDESLHYAMDAEFFIRAAAAGLKLTHIPRMLAAFRYMEGTKSTSSGTVFWPDMLEIFRRHNGAGAMAPFLARYYFDEGAGHGYDVRHMEGRRGAMLERWGSLPEPELRVLAARSDKAMGLALVMLAGHAFLKGEAALADGLAADALARDPSLRTHPYMLSYRLKKAVGLGPALLLERLKRRAAHYYGFRYDHRYLFRKVERLLRTKDKTNRRTR